MIGRIFYAILWGVGTMVALVIAADIFSIAVLSEYAGLIGLLVALVVFFSGTSPAWHK